MEKYRKCLLEKSYTDEIQSVEPVQILFWSKFDNQCCSPSYFFSASLTEMLCSLLWKRGIIKHKKLLITKKGIIPHKYIRQQWTTKD